jgi:hypothetical protein
MHKEYEAPQLTVVGEMKDVVMGVNLGSSDNGLESAPDFEFLPDWPLV